jgi:ubiquinone/menaquinone biosynthesis C-methylase UbiE
VAEALPMTSERYVPAAGRAWLTPLFDPALAATMRERRWRGRLVEEALAGDPKAILDVGCGTGTLAVQLADRAPSVRVIGLDGDPEILRLVFHHLVPETKQRALAEIRRVLSPGGSF